MSLDANARPCPGARIWVRRACAALAASCASISFAAPTIRIEPAARVLDGEPVHISVAGLTAGAEATLTAERWFDSTSGRLGPRLLRSEAKFAADSAGAIDLRSAKALSGTYRGVDPRGLFWSMVPVAGRERAATGSVDTSEIRFSLQAADARHEARMHLPHSLPEVKVVAADGLPGAVFAALPGKDKRPAIILLGGSEGGLAITHGAAPLASHGFAVLALPLFSPPDRTGAREIPALPAAWADMPVETLNKARDWLAAREDVDATRIALHGTSMGALLALLGGVHLPWVAGVVASVPSDVVWDGWGPGIVLGQRSTFSVGGVPLPFVPLAGYEQEVQGYERNEPVILRRAFERGRAARPDLAAKARVPVERIRVPVMVIGGYDDQMWPSGNMAQTIVERRSEHGLDTEALIFPEAGHFLYDTGYAPTTSYNAGLRKSGGTPEANARAQAEAWPRTLRFLKRVLKAG